MKKYACGAGLVLAVALSGQVFATISSEDSVAYAGKKRTVCTMTLSSSDEILEFKKHLNPTQFDFVELVGYQGKSNWLNAACTDSTKNLKCDVLLISGHFTGYRFDGSQNLYTTDLMQRSCANSCGGILNNPLEVFMFACNTLSSKELDHRTPDIYRSRLLEHGIPENTVDWLVQLRYGIIDPSNSEQISTVFKGVPHIYGFDSTAPLGNQIAPSIKNYLAARGDYAAWLDQVEKTKLGQNTVLKKSLGWTSLKEVSGIQMSPSTREASELYCTVTAFVKTRPAKLLAMEKVIQKGETLRYLTYLNMFFTANPPDKESSQPYGKDSESNAIYKRIQNNQQAKQSLQRIFNGRGVDNENIDYMIFQLAEELGWDNAKIDDEVQRNLRARFASDADHVCDYAPGLRFAFGDMLGMDLENLLNGPANADQLRALECMGTPKHLYKVLAKNPEQICKLSEPVKQTLGYFLKYSEIWPYLSLPVSRAQVEALDCTGAIRRDMGLLAWYSMNCR